MAVSGAAWIRTKVEECGLTLNLHLAAKANPADKKGGNFPLPTTTACTVCPDLMQEWKSLLSLPGISSPLSRGVISCCSVTRSIAFMSWQRFAFSSAVLV